MISTQIIRNCIERLNAIARTELSVQSPSGTLLAATSGMNVPDPEIAAAFSDSAADSQIMGNRFLLKVFEEEELRYVLTVMGESDNTFLIGRIAADELEQLLYAYREKYDRSTYFRNLLLGNLSETDINSRARKLHIDSLVPRAVIVFEVDPEQTKIAMDLLSGLFSVQNGNYLTETGEETIALIKPLHGKDSAKQLTETVNTAVDMLNMEAMIKVRAACGTAVPDLKGLPKSFREAVTALEVGRLFYAERIIFSYDRLGIGRLIYQLPQELCGLFIREVFGTDEPVEFDEETMTTIRTFLENNLNVSETARKLFLHRNTLVYRIEKVQKSTGLDIRRFDDAMTLWIALMVSKLLNDLSGKKE